MAVELYKHNAYAYEQIEEKLKTSNRTCVIHPTGSGKSFIAIKWLYENRNRNCLFLTSQKPIIDQIIRHIESCGLTLNDFPNLKFDLYQNITEQVAKTYSTDCIVLDEFHRCGAPEWGKGLDVLLNNNSNAKVLGFSATPIRYLDDCRNMTEELFDNNIASQITLVEAVAKGILPLPTYINALYSFDEDIQRIQKKINRLASESDRKLFQEKFDSAKRLLEKSEGLEKVFSKNITKSNGRFIVFCRDVEHMNRMIEESKNWFESVNDNIDIYSVISTNKDFDNRNEHEYPNINTDGSSAKDSESIQHPVRTRSFFAQLQDNVIWNDIFSSQLGIRYDWDELVPQDLKAFCRACSSKPASNTFQSLSGSFGLDAQLNDIWKIGYNISTGFRIPTASEMYFSFEHPAGNWIPNPDLKAEQALNQSIYIQADHQLGSFGLTFYHTRYKNFLTEQESTYKKRNPYYNAYSASYGQQAYYTTIAQKAVNIDRAHISGVEFTSKVNLDQIISAIPQGWKFTANLGYAKGKLSGTEASLLSIQPIKVILGIGYEDPNDRWGVNVKASYLGAKKAKDAQIVQYSTNFVREVKTYPYLNNSAVLFDLYGFYKVNKNIILRAGLYNLFNRKYHTWDTLRGINKISTTDSVDKEGKGLERFYAPGRNFAASVEIRF